MLNKNDAKKLEKLLKQIEKIQDDYNLLTPETQEFLQQEFKEGTRQYLYNFDSNITDAIKECKE